MFHHLPEPKIAMINSCRAGRANLIGKKLIHSLAIQKNMLIIGLMSFHKKLKKNGKIIFLYPNRTIDLLDN
ncbi:hypothetical protein ATY38_09225 [Nitrosomonas ureae]|nr:hypothetical protein ATY38_09225 [Nitrosomonas ureae]